MALRYWIIQGCRGRFALGLARKAVAVFFGKLAGFLFGRFIFRNLTLG